MNSNNNSSRSTHFLLNTKLFIAIALLIFFIVLSANLHLVLNDKNGLNTNNKLKNSDNNENRMLMNEEELKLYFDEILRRSNQNENLFESIMNKTYEGIWESNNYFIGKSNSGIVNLKIVRINEIYSRQQGIGLLFRLCEKKYIDHWAIFNSYSKFVDLKYDINNENEISFYGLFSTQSATGQYFSKNLTSYQSKVMYLFFY